VYIHHFKQTPPIGTYITACHAGPYNFIEKETGKVPMKLYVRKTQASDVDAKEYFRICDAAISFYETFFSTPYPFEKYDTVFAPELRINGMENVGATIHSSTLLKPKEA
jgi:aminopeptidase N